MRLWSVVDMIERWHGSGQVKEQREAPGERQGKQNWSLVTSTVEGESTHTHQLRISLVSPRVAESRTMAWACTYTRTRAQHGQDQHFRQLPSRDLGVIVVGTSKVWWGRTRLGQPFLSLLLFSAAQMLSSACSRDIRDIRLAGLATICTTPQRGVIGARRRAARVHDSGHVSSSPQRSAPTSQTDAVHKRV
jgi:hypothetical protein